jgi:choline dehydrogenase-like flavoprotein
MIVQELPAGSARSGSDLQHPVLVIGAGPVGLVHALELRRRGVEVMVLAGGIDGFSAEYQAMADADIVDAHRHAPMDMAVRRALGGTSLLWGGRCIPFDAIDFAGRPQVPLTGWPLSAADVKPWYRNAMRYLDAGPAEFVAPLPALAAMPDCRFDRLERWSDGRNLRQLHAEALANDRGLRICLGAVAVGLDIDPATGHVAGVRVAAASGERATISARAVVVACGGLETTRLLLTTQMHQPMAFGGPEGALGRFYMGHLEGRIADIVFADATLDNALSFFIDRNGRYVRRRFTIADEVQHRDGLLNLAAWPDNPALAEPAHRSAILSLAYLSLATPKLGALLAPEAVRRKHLEHGVQGVPRHLANILCGVPEAAREAARFLHGRYLAKPRLPGFFIANKARRYAFFYHAEQAPNPASRVTLTDKRDALGIPRLRIDLRYDEIDARSVIASHRIFDRNLRDAGVAQLDYTVPGSEQLASVLEQATDGYHQIGTTRMSDSPATGVVDRDCRVHGTANLFIAGSSVFPTSGQANPTLLATALAARLAAHIARIVTASPPPETVLRRREPEPALP